MILLESQATIKVSSSLRRHKGTSLTSSGRFHDNSFFYTSTMQNKEVFMNDRLSLEVEGLNSTSYKSLSQLLIFLEVKYQSKRSVRLKESSIFKSCSKDNSMTSRFVPKLRRTYLPASSLKILRYRDAYIFLISFSWQIFLVSLVRLRLVCSNLNTWTSLESLNTMKFPQ